MAWLMFLVWGPVLTGLVLALVWWLLRGRMAGLPDGSGRVIPVLAGLVLLFAVAFERLVGVPLVLPFDVPMVLTGWYSDYRFAFPLLVGILGLVLLAFPARSRAGRGAAELSPRTPISFGRRWWFATPTVVVAFIVLTTVIAGTASSPEPTTGRYAVYFVDIGGQGSMGTSIYGWFYSVPCLILLALMLAAAYLDLFLISRPALDHNHVKDTRVRTVRTRNVLAVTAGALLVHFGVILQSLAGTASMRGQFTAAGGTVTSWTTFAALEPVFLGASFVLLALGVAHWATVPLSAIPARQPAKAMATS
ncbi:hypothetical protein F7P69_25980 [Cellulosimicrobium funkei]|nr:hypothetical protein [Cellulosimicrobium funkei]